MRPASIVIVGAGVMGASVAYHLAARGCRDVLLLDRCARPGQGSTGAATGGFRAQYGTVINVRLSLLAREKLLQFRDEIGIDPGYLPAGYLWLAVSRMELELLRRGMRVQQAEGLHEVTEVNLDDVRRLNPAVQCDAVLGGVFCPTDGFIAPLQMLNGYLAVGCGRAPGLNGRPASPVSYVVPAGASLPWKPRKGGSTPMPWSTPLAHGRLRLPKQPGCRCR